jgi:23S rRNA (pseudouridine1915-N3)-methyltransferase
MIRIVAVGRMKDSRLAGLLEDYLQRIRPLAPVGIVEIRDSDPEREGRDMVARLGSVRGRELVVALDEHGDEVTSAEIAALLGGHGSIAFLVGGADGLGPAARERADRTVRLSSLTLTHEMARVLLAEQVYRGLSILRGRPYHRA